MSHCVRHDKTPVIELSENSFYNLNDDRNYQAKNDHRCNGKIKSEISFFNSYIAGQSADPV